MATEDPAPRRRLARLRVLLARKQPLVCQEMVELVTAYLDGVLDPLMQARFEAHLKKCDGCSAYLEGLRVTLAALGAIHEEQLDPVFRARLMNAFAETTGSL
jgi:anti-sigma factor RsiW